MLPLAQASDNRPPSNGGGCLVTPARSTLLMYERYVRDRSTTANCRTELMAQRAIHTVSGRADRGQIGAAVLALRRRNRKVFRKTSRTGLDRCGLAEHCFTATGHDRLVGHDDQEIQHAHEHDEVDHRR